MISKKRFKRGIVIKPDTEVLEGINGELKVDSADSKIKTTLGGTPHEVITNDQMQTLTNKSIDADNNTISNLEVDNLKAGVLDTDLNMVSPMDDTIPSAKATKAYVDAAAATADANLQAHINDAIDAHDASAISNIPFGTISSTDVQSAINELDGDIQGHINDMIDAHDASAISVIPTGNLLSDNVQDALVELQLENDTQVVGPAMATDNAIARFDGTTGKLIQDSNVTVSDLGDVVTPASVTADTITGTSSVTSPIVNANTKLNTPEVSSAGSLTLSPATHTSNSNKQIKDVADPTDPQDAATKAYVDGASANVEILDEGVSITGTVESINFVGAGVTATAVGNDVTVNIPGGGGGGGTGVGDLDTIFTDDFETSVLADYIQVGLAIVTANALHDNFSARLIHQTATPTPGLTQYFERTIPLDDAFQKKVVEFAVKLKSTASSGNITVSVKDQLGATLYSGVLESNSRQIANLTTTTGSATVGGFTNANIMTVEVNQLVTGTGIPTGTYITAVNTGALTVTLSANATATGTTTLSFSSESLEQKFTFTTLENTTSLVYRINALVQNGLPESYFDDVVIKLADAYENNVALIEEEDTAIVAAGNNGEVITVDVTNIPFNLVSSKGSDILSGVGTYTALESGLYNFTGSVFFTAAATRAIRIYVNGVVLRTVSDSPNAAQFKFDVSNINLMAGDIVSFRANATGGTLSNSTTLHWINISKQGSLKQIVTNGESKISIPTSELRFEGASTRGTTNTQVVRFDNVTKVRGGDLTYTNTATNGTEITFLKSGLVNIQTQYITVAGQNVYIAKNALTQAATNGETALAINVNGSTGNFTEAIYSGFIKAGDVVRVLAGVNPTADIRNSLNITFQAQEIQVSVSNTLPQFSDSDTSIRLDTANGYGSVGTKIRRFLNLRENFDKDVTYIPSAINGDSFLILEDGIYNISYTDYQNAVRVGITLNSNNISTNVSTLALNPNNEVLALVATGVIDIECASWQGRLSKGDVIRAHTDGAAATDNDAVKFTISKVGKPNVEAVDVTPFIDIPQEKRQTAVYTALTYTTATFPVKISSLATSTTGSSIFTVDNSGASSRIVALKDCTLDIHYNSLISASGASLIVRKNGIAVNILAGTSTHNTGQGDTVSGELFLATGEYIEIGSSAGTVSSAGANGSLVLSAKANSSQILSEVETFSTDTASLTYASSALYTLATLPNSPIGTYITFTYAANTNTRTQTTTRPTQTDADMNANGFLITARAYNAASVAATPSTFVVNVGKGYSGQLLEIFKNAGQLLKGSFDYYVLGTNGYGALVKDYNPTTGLLFIDAGAVDATVTNVHLFTFEDVSQASTGYVTFTASKNPALTGVFVPEVISASYFLSANQSVTANTQINFDSKEFDTHNAVTTGVGVWKFTAPESGFYSLQGVTDQVTAGIFLVAYKNGVAHKSVSYDSTGNLAGIVSAVIKLNKGEFIDVRPAVTATFNGAGLQAGNAGVTHISITRVGK